MYGHTMNKGKPSDWVRDQFVFALGQDKKATCRHCKRYLSTLNVSRMKEHLTNTRVCPFLRQPDALLVGEHDVRRSAARLQGINLPTVEVEDPLAACAALGLLTPAQLEGHKLQLARMVLHNGVHARPTPPPQPRVN